MARLGDGLELDGAVALRPVLHHQACRGSLHPRADVRRLRRDRPAGVRLLLALIDVPMFLAATILGLAVLLAIGICLGGISFLTAKHTHGLAEGIPGLFCVFCGVLFPLSILPGWGQAVGRAIPLTYWFDLTRRLLAPNLTVNTTLTGYDAPTILLFLLVSSVAFFGLSVLIFKMGEYFARKAGKIDMTTSY